MLRLFLSHASADTPTVVNVHQKLKAQGFAPWMAERDLQPGDAWQDEIRRAIAECDVFLAFVSYSYAAEGWQAKELRQAVARARAPRIIPVRLDQSKMPDELAGLYGVEIFRPDGLSQLIQALFKLASQELPELVPPQELIHACQRGECAVYVGAGLSAPLGFPTWRPLVGEMLEWAEKQGNLFSTKSLLSLKANLERGDADVVADNVVAAALREQSYDSLQAALRDTFDRPVSPTALHSLLPKLGLSAVLTTNLDSVLETTFDDDPTFTAPPVFTPRDTEPLLDALSARKFFLLKLFGDLRDPPSVVIAPKQYEDSIVGNQAFSQFMDGLFVSRTLLFLGASLEGIEDYLSPIKFRGRGSRPHYALVAVSGPTWRAKADSLEHRYGIKVLPYALNEKHGEVETFLRTLLVEVKGEPAADAAPGSVAATATASRTTLQSVYLENIGPFKNGLTLSFNESWNVLLGDNGVGKSSILRAIAIAVCGKDAAREADRLIAQGATSAKVVLRTSNGREFITQIWRTASDVEISCLPTRLLESEGWLVLGFPALRMVSWERVTGPKLETSKRRPAPSDALPLVSASPDPRTDGLKQWIFNMDYRIKEGGPDGARYQRMLDDFFDAIGSMTGDLVIEFGRIDSEKGRVLLVTDDGEVPLESVSQGTVSLLGWIGVLIQRLYEVYDESPNPRNEFALVLMDEIDAHMHPEWQLNLVPRFSKLFPNVQFIASTHSPLVVSGMDASQVLRLARDDDGAVVQLDVTQEMTLGRADQVLTGDLFGLRTTLDHKTTNEIEAYQQLLGLKSRSPSQENEFQRLRKQLALRIPQPYEMPKERRAAELVRLLIKSQLGDEHGQAQEELNAKARELLDACAEKQP